jgi:hypothetical protein
VGELFWHLAVMAADNDGTKRTESSAPVPSLERVSKQKVATPCYTTRRINFSDE